VSVASRHLLAWRGRQPGNPSSQRSDLVICSRGQRETSDPSSAARGDEQLTRSDRTCARASRRAAFTPRLSPVRRADDEDLRAAVHGTSAWYGRPGSLSDAHEAGTRQGRMVRWHVTWASDSGSTAAQRDPCTTAADRRRQSLTSARLRRIWRHRRGGKLAEARAATAAAAAVRPSPAAARPSPPAARQAARRGGGTPAASGGTHVAPSGTPVAAGRRVTRLRLGAVDQLVLHRVQRRLGP
jgi:hypothetical protein